MRASAFLLGVGAIAACIATHAENLGAIGPVYPIAEKHLLEQDGIAQCRLQVRGEA